MKYACKAIGRDVVSYEVENLIDAVRLYAKEAPLKTIDAVSVVADDPAERRTFQISVRIVPVAEVYVCQWKGRKTRTHIPAYHARDAARLFSEVHPPHGTKRGIVCVEDKHGIRHEITVGEGK